MPGDERMEEHDSSYVSSEEVDSYDLIRCNGHESSRLVENLLSNYPPIRECSKEFGQTVEMIVHRPGRQWKLVCHAKSKAP